MTSHPPRGPHRSRPRVVAPQSAHASLLARLLLAGIALTAAGCSVVGLAANAMPEADVPAKYSGLRDHSVAVLVWTPRGLETDFPSLRIDLTTAIQARLQQA